MPYFLKRSLTLGTRRLENLSLRKTQSLNKIYPKNILPDIIDILINFFIKDSNLPNNQRILPIKKNSLFYSIRQPKISIKNYIKRIENLTNCSDNSLILGFIYFDRIIHKNLFTMEKLNLHKFHIKKKKKISFVFYFIKFQNLKKLCFMTL